MKQVLYILIFTFVLAHTALAQSWEPIRDQNIYNYTKPSSDSVLGLKFTDNMPGKGYKCYTLNNREINCSGYKIANGQVYLPILVKVPVSSFKLHYIIDKGLRKFAFGNDTAILNPNAEPGSTWPFDSIHTAKVLSKAFIHYLDFDDSVKTILIGSADTILLSRQYGILKYPLFDKLHQHYNLKGIEPTTHGFHYPYAKDIFNFNVGDSFEYYFDNYSTRGISTDFFNVNTPFIHTTGLQLWSITAKEIYPDRYKYTYQGYQTIGAKVSRVNSSVTIYFNDNRFTGLQAYGGIYENGIYGRSNSYIQNSTTYRIAISPGSDTLAEVSDPNIELTEGNEQYFAGLGCTHLYYNDGLSGTAEVTLRAYRKGTQRSGNFKPIDTSSLIPPVTAFNLSIGPVPVSNKLYVNYESPEKTSGTITLIDMNGKTYLPSTIYTLAKNRGTFDLDMSLCPAGVYVLRFDGESINRMFKIVVLK